MITMFPNLSDGFLLGLVTKGALLMTIAFAITFVLRRKSAALRHAVWSLAFVGLLLLPFCTALLPAWQVSIPGIVAATEVAGRQADSIVSWPAAAAYTSTAETSALHTASQSSAAGEIPIRTGAETETGDWISSSTTTWAWTDIAVLVWLVGAIALLIRLALVLAKLSLLRKLSEPVVSANWLERAGALAHTLKIRRPVRILQHEEIVVPMTYGVRRPVILLPVHAKDWSDDEMQVTLMHELLHVKRYDHLVHILALSARALHWFNPLAWAATKRLVVERERACDDGVLSMGVASTSYANHLLEIARDVLSGREASSAALAMARPSELRTRIVAILDPAQPRRRLSRLRMVGMTTCALLLVGSLAAMQPRPLDGADVTANVVETFNEVIDETAASTADLVQDATGLAAENAEHEARPAADPITATQSARTLEGRADTADVQTQRRAVFAISELPREQSIPLLTEIATDNRNPLLREEAVFWLGEVGDASVAELLESFARNDANPDVQQKAIFALSELEDRRGIPRLLDLARTHSSVELRAEAVFWLGEGGGADVAEELATFARSDDSQVVQRKAIFALAELDQQAGVPHLIDLAKSHADAKLRSEAIFWLGETGDPRAADVLMDIVNGN